MNREDLHLITNHPDAQGTALFRDFDCKDLGAVLSGLVDDVLDAQTRHAAERHLVACAGCTARVEEAERFNDLLAEGIHVSDSLPEGFADAVLAATTRRDRFVFRQPRWMAWSGWMAAAATFLLAASLLYFDNRNTARNDGLTPGGVGNSGIAGANRNNNDAAPPSRGWDDYYASADQFRSQVRNPVIPKTVAASAMMHTVVNPRGEGGGGIAANGGDAGDAMTVSNTSGLEEESSVSIAPAPQAGLSRDDQDTLYATANVLDHLFDFDVTSLRVAEQMREIVVYDELLARLADVRSRVKPEDRMKLGAAESMLYRVVNGPVSVDDLAQMKDDAARLELIPHLERLIGHTDPRNSM